MHSSCTSPGVSAAPPPPPHARPRRRLSTLATMENLSLHAPAEEMGKGSLTDPHRKLLRGNTNNHCALRKSFSRMVTSYGLGGALGGAPGGLGGLVVDGGDLRTLSDIGEHNLALS